MGNEFRRWEGRIAGEGLWLGSLRGHSTSNFFTDHFDTHCIFTHCQSSASRWWKLICDWLCILRENLRGSLWTGSLAVWQQEGICKLMVKGQFAYSMKGTVRCLRMSRIVDSQAAAVLMGRRCLCCCENKVLAVAPWEKHCSYQLCLLSARALKK